MGRSNAGHFVSALAGIIVGALLVSAVPAGAGDGDPVYLGQRNAGKTVTRINTRGGLRVDNFKAGNPALILTVADPATAPMQVNGTGKVGNLNVDAIDGFDADMLVRFAHAASSEISETAVFGSLSYGDLLTTSITAPTDGALLIVGGADSYMFNADGQGDQFTCLVRVDGAGVVGSERMVRPSFESTSSTVNDEEDCSTNGAVEVGQGQHTVALRVTGRNPSGTGVRFAEASLQVLFVPFGPDGTLPSVP